MKPQHFAVLAGTLLVMAVILLLAGRSPAGKEQTAPKPTPTVTVLGEGEFRVRPDQATLTFSVSTWTEGASATEAEALNLASAQRLAEAVKSAGVAAEAVELDQPSIVPVTRQDFAGKTNVTGYQATRRVVVTTTSLGKVDAVTAAGLANGATGLEATVYGLQDPGAARQKALAAAVQEGREQAVAIASAQNRSLGDLLSVEVLAEEDPVPSAGAVLYKTRVRVTFGF